MSWARNRWVLTDGRVIYLLYLEDFNRLPPDAQLINIFGEIVQKKDADNDTRGGYVAYGLVSEMSPC